MDNDSPPTQPTQPHGTDAEGKPYEPIEIPVPKKKDVIRILKKSAKPLLDKSKQKSK
jgi:hypothetical protein